MAEATTEVLVVPDFSGFVGALRRGIDDSVRQISGVGGAILAPIAAQAAQTGKKIGDQLAAGVGQGARGAAGAMVQPLAAGGAAGGRAAGTQFANQFVPQSQNAIRKVTGFLTTAFAGVALTATGLLGKSLAMGFQRATLIEDSKSAMNIILGSVEEADKLMAGVLETVTGTPFNLDQFADAAKTLVAFNIEADKVPDILTAIGTAAAASGRGAEGVGSLVNTFGQMAATGRVSLEDVWSISASGINALAILANHFGITANAMKDMISEGSVPAAESIDVLMKGIMEGSDGAAGKVRGLGGSMEALRKTVSGAVGGFKAAMARAGANLLGPVLAESPDTINRMSAVLDAVSKRIGAVITAAANSKPFQDFLDSINGFLDRLAAKDGKFLDQLAGQLERIAPLAAGAGAALTAMGANGLPFIGQFLPKINPLVAGIVAIATATPQGREALTNFAESLRPVIEDLVPKLVPLLEDLSKILSGVLTAGFEAAAVAVKAVVVIVEPLLPAITALTGFIADNEAVVWGLVAAYTAWAIQAKLAAAANAAAMLSGGGAGAAGAAGAAGGAAQVGLFTKLVALSGKFKANLLARMGVGIIGPGMKALPALLATITAGFRAAAASAWLMGAGVAGLGVAIGKLAGQWGAAQSDDAASAHFERVKADLDLQYGIINNEADLVENRRKLLQRREELAAKDKGGLQNVAAGAERFVASIGLGGVMGNSANNLLIELAAVDAELRMTDAAITQVDENASKIGESLFESMPKDFSDVEAATSAVKRLAEAQGLVLTGDWESEDVQATFDTIVQSILPAAAAADALGVSLDQAMDIDPAILEESMKRIQGFVDSVRGTLTKEQSFLNILDEPVNPDQLADAMEAVREAEAGLSSARGDDARSRAEDAESAAERAQDAADKIADAEDKIATAQDKLNRARLANQRSGSFQSAQDMAEAEREIAAAQRDRAEAGRAASESNTRSADGETAATKRLQEARERLAEVQASDSPFNAEKIKDHFETLLANTQDFSANLDKAMQMGYHPSVVAEIMTAGPEVAGERLRTLVGEHGNEIMEMVNAYYTALEGMNVKILEQARIYAVATDPNTGSADKTKWASKAAQVSASLLSAEQKGETISSQELAFYNGISEERLGLISDMFDLDIESRVTDAAAAMDPVKIPAVIDLRTPDGFEKQVPVRHRTPDGFEWRMESDSSVAESERQGRIDRGVDVALNFTPQMSDAEAQIQAMAARFSAIAAVFGIEVPVDADTEPARAAMDAFIHPTIIPETPITAKVTGDWLLFDAQAAARNAAVFTAAQVFQWRWGGIMAYAKGGIEAHVAGRQVIRYAEPQTGGEAFIPRLGNQARSEEIARIAAGWLGGAFLTSKELSKIPGYALGGIRMSDSGIAAARPGAVMSSIAGMPGPSATAPRGQGDIRIDNLVVKSGGTRGAIAMLRQAKKRRWLDDEEAEW